MSLSSTGKPQGSVIGTPGRWFGVVVPTAGILLVIPAGKTLVITNAVPSSATDDIYITTPGGGNIKIAAGSWAPFQSPLVLKGLGQIMSLVATTANGFVSGYWVE